MSTIFISYSHTNQVFVRQLRDDLIARGHVVHWDMDAVLADDLSTRLDEWVRESDVHLAVLSHRYLQSTLPMQEVGKFLRAATERGTRLIPLLLEPVEVPEPLRPYPYVDFTQRYETGLGMLAEWLASDATNGAQSGSSGEDGEKGGSQDPVPPADAQLVSEAPLVMRVARTLAKADGAGTQITLEHLCWAVFVQGQRTQLNGTVAQCWDWLSGEVGNVGWNEAFHDRFEKLGSPLSLPVSPVVGPVDRSVAKTITAAGAIARRTSHSPQVFVRHLVGSLLVVPPEGETRPPLYRFLERFGRDGAALQEAVSRFISNEVREDSADAWAEILRRTWTVAELAGEPAADNAPGGEPRPSARPFSLVRGSISDQATDTDSLGFDLYVQAIAEFLTSPDTRPPLTLSIEGEWGSGKSSFMKQLQDAIVRLETEKKHPPPVTVWFNPWRHDREDAVWAAFALAFLRGVTRELPFRRRCAGHISLLWRRFMWRDGWWDMARALGVIATAVSFTGVVVWLLLSGGALVEAFTRELQIEKGKGLLGALLKLGGVGGAVALGATLWKEVKSFVGNPLRIDLKRYVRSPDYQARITFIEHFHEDFGKIVKAYVGERRVYVFIDDLDRCQTPKAADLMQALNLMMGSEEQPITFILGMDREKIAASLAVKFKDVLPFLTADPSRPGKLDDGEAALRGLEYGSEFIEKFVQLAFRVPQPRDADVVKLLRDLSGTPGTPPPGPAQTAPKQVIHAAIGSRPVRRGVRIDHTEGAWPPTTVRPLDDPPTPDPPSAPQRQAMQSAVSVDSERLHDIVRMVAPALDYNPRRLKQFVNLFRLRAYLAIATGLIGDRAEGSELTFEKLGKFVAIGLRWPLLMNDLESEPDLLHRLQRRARVYAPEHPTPEIASIHEDPKHALNDALGAELFWTRRSRLMELLRTDVRGADEQLAVCYTLEDLNVVPLLQVAVPAARPTAATTQEPTGQPETLPL